MAEKTRAGREGFRLRKISTNAPMARGRGLVRGGPVRQNGPGGLAYQVHAHFSDPKKGMHITAEQSMDKGTTWSKGPDIVCKK
jgi:hypothetical protein